MSYPNTLPTLAGIIFNFFTTVLNLKLLNSLNPNYAKSLKRAKKE